MKLPTGSNSARLVLWVAISALPLAALGGMAQRIPAIAQGAAPTFEIPAELPQDASISIGSDATMAVVSESLKKQFTSQFADAAVTVAASGSDAALASLNAGNVDMAATGRPLSEAEQAQGLTPVVLDREKIAIFVAEENAFQGDIGFAQFAQIFRGEVTDWSELGGEAGAIRFIDRPDSSDTRRSLSFYPVFEGTPFAAGPTAQAVNEDNTALVIKNLGIDGIGYAPYSQVKAMPGIRILSMHNVLPSDAAYPYSQPRVLVYKGEPTPAVQAFLAVATNAAGQTAINEAEAAEAAALASGENPIGEQALAQVGAVTEATPNAAGGLVEGTAAVVDDAANVAGDAASKAVDAAGAAGDAVGNVAGAAGDAAGDAAGNVADAAGDAAAAAGDVVGNLPGAGALQGRGLSPLWGVLPLAAIAAGGGLLWWLAAGKDDDDNFAELDDDSRELVGVGTGLRGKAGELDEGAAGLSAAGLGAAGGAVDGAAKKGGGFISGLFGKAKDAAGTATDAAGVGIKGAGDAAAGAVEGVSGTASGVANKLSEGAGNVAGGLKEGVANAADGVQGGAAELKNAAGDAIEGAKDKADDWTSDV